jgi:hypothetical protein
MYRKIFIVSISLIMLSCESLGFNLDELFSSNSTGQIQYSGGNARAQENENAPMVQNIDATLLRYSPDSIRILDEVAKAGRVTRKSLISLWYYPSERDGLNEFYNTRIFF